MKTDPTSTFLEGWRTARVTSRRHANLCIGRLQNQSIDHQLLREEADIRIVVRRPDLQDAIRLLDDIAKPRPVAAVNATPQCVAIAILVGIPFGSSIGAACASWLEFNTIPWSVCGAVYASVLLVGWHARCAQKNEPQRSEGLV